VKLRITTVATILTLMASSVLCQQMPQNKDPDSALTNDDIVQMASLGLPDNLVIAKIKAAKTVNFDTSPTGLKALSDARVHDLVVEAMISRQDGGKVDVSPSARSGPAAGAPSADPNDPMAPHDSGVYLLKDGRLTPMDPAVFQGEKHTSMLRTMASQGLAKQRMKAVLRGPHAPTQLSDAKPVFYFYFDKDASAGTLMSMSPEPKSPRDYLLVKLEVTRKDRELETMEAGITGTNMNATTKTAVNFSSEKIAPGAYKITVDSPLGPGEYCFLSGGGTMGLMATTGHVYDFGVAKSY
jgi:hypothetical protein